MKLKSIYSVRTKGDEIGEVLVTYHEGVSIEMNKQYT
jgi:hypothetical protein